MKFIRSTDKRGRKSCGYFTSLIRIFKNNGIIDEHFLSQIDMLSLEDLIAIKIEYSVKKFGNKVYGIPLFEAVVDIVNEALLKIAFGGVDMGRRKLMFYGVNNDQFESLIRERKRLKIDKFLDEQAKIEKDLLLNRAMNSSSNPARNS